MEIWIRILLCVRIRIWIWFQVWTGAPLKGNVRTCANSADEREEEDDPGDKEVAVERDPIYGALAVPSQSAPQLGLEDLGTDMEHTAMDEHIATSANSAFEMPNMRISARRGHERSGPSKEQRQGESTGEEGRHCGVL